EAGVGHDFSEPAEIVEQQRAGALPNFSREAEEQRDRNSVRENQQRRAIRSEQSSAGDPEKNVTHVHHARIAEHPIEALLRDRDKPGVNEVAEKEREQKRGPLLRALRQERERDAAQSIK